MSDNVPMTGWERQKARLEEIKTRRDALTSQDVDWLIEKAEQWLEENY